MRLAVKRSQNQTRAVSFWRKWQKFLSKRLRLFFFSIFLVVGSTLVFLSLYLFQLFRQNLSLAGNGSWFSSSDLETGQTFNLLLLKLTSLADPVAKIEAAAVFNVQPSAQRANIFLLPVNVSLDIPGLGPNLKLSSLYGLARLKTGRAGGFNLTKAVSLGLGIPLAGMVLADEAVAPSLTQPRGAGAPSFFDVLKTLPRLGSSIRTDLSARSLLSLAAFLAFRFPQNLETYLLEKVLSDPLTLDAFWRPKIVDGQVLAERQSLIVLNATAIPGLAGGVARLGANLGLSVLSADNDPETSAVEQSRLYARSVNSLGARSLARDLGILQISSLESLAERSSFQRLRRADLVLILGRDAIFEE